MSETRRFVVYATLPNDVADAAERIAAEDDLFFRRVIIQAVIRRTIYKSLHRSMGERVAGLDTHMEREA